MYRRLDIGRQTAIDIDDVNPEISRKEFDAINKENVKLKKALKHIVPTELGGKDVVLVSEKHGGSR